MIMKMMKITCMITTAIYCIWITDSTIGQTMNVTESTLVGHHILDYQYEDINAELISSNKSGNSNNRTTNNQTNISANTQDDGMFYPLYGEALNPNRQSSNPAEEIPAHDPPLPATPDPVPPLKKVFPDYTEGGDIPIPGGGWWGSKKFRDGPRWPPNWGTEKQAGLMMDSIRKGYQMHPNAMPFWNNDRMSGGDAMESLRKEFRIIKHYGLVNRLEELQIYYPHVNVTRLYDNYQKYSRQNQNTFYGDRDELGEDFGYWYNGSFIYYPRHADYEADEGFWHNGTYYPFMEEMGEDGYWYNGTFYPSEYGGVDLEDGYLYNGTFYYMPDAEGSDFEDGFFYNGTFYPEVWDDEQEDREELMWWQRHHPKWQDRTNNAERWWGRRKWPPHFKASAHPLYSSLLSSMRFPFLATKSNVAPSSPQGSRRKSTETKQASPEEWRSGRMVNQNWKERSMNSNPLNNFHQRRWRDQMHRERQRLRQKQINQGRIRDLYRNFGRRQHRRPIHPRRHPADNTKSVSSINGNPHAPFLYNIDNWKPRGNFASGQAMRKDGVPVHGSEPFAAAQQGEAIRKTSSPLDPYRDSSTAAIGIVFACILGLTLILGPLACMLHAYRQNKRMKKRTFLRRPEMFASVEEGLVDAMVRSELGAVGGADESKPFNGSAVGPSSQQKKDLGFVTKVKSKGTEMAEKRCREKKEYRQGRRWKEKGVEWERKAKNEIEMMEMRRANKSRGMASRSLPPPPSSPNSSFQTRHQLYTPRNTVIGAREELRQEQNSLPAPMSIIGMDSEDEIIRVDGK